MRRYEDECVSCGLPCLGSSCPNRNVLRIYCDRCDSEADYCFDEEDLCENCLEKELDAEWLRLPLSSKIEAYQAIYDCDIEDLNKW